jgi:hypothetical protein
LAQLVQITRPQKCTKKLHYNYCTKHLTPAHSTAPSSTKSIAVNTLKPSTSPPPPIDTPLGHAQQTFLFHVISGAESFSIIITCIILLAIAHKTARKYALGKSHQTYSDHSGIYAMGKPQLSISEILGSAQ